MKILVLLTICACSGWAAITGFQVQGTTSTQVLVSYKAPDANACTIQVSQSASLTPLALDVDPATFANSNLDLSRPSTVTSGMSRTLLIGQRTVQYATAGAYSGVRHFSRALQAYTPYFGMITCPSTGDTYNFTFSTGNIPLGMSYGDPLPADPADPGNQPWPEAVGGLSPESFIDPLTGTYLTRLGLRSNNFGYWGSFPFGSAFNQGQFPCDSAGPWTNPCGTIVTGGAGSVTVLNSQAPLIIRPPLAGGNAFNGGYGSNNYGSMWTLDQFAVSLTGLGSSTTSAFRVLDVCLSLNGGASCANSAQQITMGQTSSVQKAGQYNTTQYGVIPWLLDTKPRLNVQEASPHSGAATVSGNTVTWVSGNLFSLYWVTGGNGTVRLSTVSSSDACATPPNTTSSTEYTILGMPDGNHLTVSGTPPAGSVYWCADNFAVMVWRDQAPSDGSSITLTAASMAAIESTSPTYPDNGADHACFNKLVQGGYFCLYGGLYWINPQTGASAYYGYMTAPSNNQSGQAITNPWHTIGIIPASESANIDQSQNVLTFYTTAIDPTSATALVIQGVFNPTTIATPAAPYVNGSQIGSANVIGSTAYSVTYNNGLTFSNLTPQVSLNQGIVAQMATLDPTFKVSQIGSPWNCQAYGFSGSLFYLGCYTSYEDGPGWILAFSPGDGNPAHAGQAGGPQIVGAISTFNTPSNAPVTPGYVGMYGHGLHAVVEADSGWVQVNTHFLQPINTSNNTLPATGVDCSTYGLASGKQCTLLNINSYTHASVTSYEPYYASPSTPFTGAPGETRTAQIGDTACVAVSTSGSCSYTSSQELLTLVAKNYQGVQGAWVFQRNGYGVEKAIATGPITLWWAAIAANMPPGSAAAGSFSVYWNPVTGCAGSPDPHGNCMTTDTNETAGHGEWRNGGEAVTTNVPDWSVPIMGWGSVYQTTLGNVPGILSLNPTNVTPDVTPGINYVNDEPPFAGVYGHPFGFDAGSHPNAPGNLAPANEQIRAFDNVPLQGGQNEPTWVSISGQLYTAAPASNLDADDPFGYGSIIAMNRKLYAQGASCGPHPLTDISGPASSISTSTASSYTYCFARTAGECYSGSSVGQVYVNCPGVTAVTCQGSGIHGGAPFGAGADICLGNINNTANAVRQFTLDRTDMAGLRSRTVVAATARTRMVYGFENNELVPDNSWLLYRSDWLDFQRAEMWAAKLPPYPPVDSVTRNTFVPVTVSLRPAAGLQVNNAIVEFGYQEYGNTLLNCTTRNDICVSASNVRISGTQPFSFISENPAGLACATGCTLVIPALSQRVLYYRVVYRSLTNSVLYTGPLTSVVVP